MHQKAAFSPVVALLCLSLCYLNSYLCENLYEFTGFNISSSLFKKKVLEI